MKKSKEAEELIKRAIRNDIALYPLKSVAEVRNALYRQGYQSLRGELDWHYVSKLMKKIREENLTELASQDRTTRLVNLKERHRIVTQKLAAILNGSDGPTFADKIAAANSILKWDMAVFFAEGSMEKSTQLEEKQEVLLLYRGSKKRITSSDTFVSTAKPTSATIPARYSDLPR